MREEKRGEKSDNKTTEEIANCCCNPSTFEKSAFARSKLTKATCIENKEHLRGKEEQ
jgi:hypothetical protein